ncbi:MAG: rod-binding protein [Rubripirellula sp.]
MDIRSIASMTPLSTPDFAAAKPGGSLNKPGNPEAATFGTIGDDAMGESVAKQTNAKSIGASHELEEAFTDFVGQTLFGSMLASMRKTVGKPAYMHGGRTEEVFQKQLDEIMVEELTEASAKDIAQPMFELFQMQRSA